MKLRKAIVTTFEDWLRRDPAMKPLVWLAGTLAIASTVPLVIVYRWAYKEPQK